MNKNPPPSYGSISSTSDVDFSSTPSTTFNALCDNIVTNLYTINSTYKMFSNSVKNIGTNRDNKGLRDKIHVMQLSTNQIIVTMKSDLGKLTIMVRKAEKQQKLQVEKLTENFKEAIARVTDIQKELVNKMKTNLLVSPVAYEQVASTDVEMQKQAQLAREMAFEQEMFLEREVNIRKIEADVLDVNEIMSELAALVQQQSEYVDDIENSIENATGHVEQGNVELQKAAQYQRKYRRRLFYLALIGIIILAVLITVLVVELKK